MHQDRTEKASRPATVRSKITNGAQLLRGDQRGPSARRYRDLCEAFGAEAGGFNGLPESGKQLVRRLAATSATLEDLEADRVAGKAVDPIQFTRLVGVQRRLLKDLSQRAAAATAPPRPTLESEIEAARRAREAAPA